MATGQRTRVGRADALALAKRKFLSGERLDIGQLAQELGINRVTLQRWVGTRDALIVAVVWPLSQATLTKEWAKVEALPGPRIPRLVGGYLRANLQGPARRFLLDENERAMKLFTLAAYGHQPLLVAAIRGYLQLDHDSGRIPLRLPLDDLAYAVERIAVSYAYLPTISGHDPDSAGAERVLEALLGPR